MQRRRRVLATCTGLMTAAVMAAGLTACGTAENGGKTSTAASTTISYWSSWNVGEPQQKILADVIAAYEKSSGITVNVRWLGRNYGDSVKNAGAVGKAPDIYDNSTDQIGAYRAHGLIADPSAVLGKTIPGEQHTVRDVLPTAALNAASDPGGLGLIPYELGSSGIWFDAATHPEWVTNPPATFDDLLAAAERLKARGRAPLAQDGSVDGYNAYWIYWLLMRHGGPGTMAALGKSPANWDKPAVLAAAKDVERLVKANLFEPSYMGTKYPAAQNQWAQRQHDLIINGTWLASETAPDQARGFNAQVFQFPSVPGGFHSVEAGAIGWSVNPKSQNMAAVEKFLAFAMQKKYMSRFSTEALNISPRSDVAPPPALAAIQKALLSATSFQGTDDSAPSLYSGWWNDVFLPLDNQLFSGQISAEQFVRTGKAQTASYNGGNG